MEYIRNPECECAEYKDKDALSFSERLNLKQYWMRGFIYDGTDSRECKCHRVFRLKGRYNRIALEAGLPSHEKLRELKYLGKSNVYEKLKNLPSKIDENNLEDILVFVTGKAGCQKTTSLAKLVFQTVLRDETVKYMTFAEFTNNCLSKADEVLDATLNVDWLFIDDCFTGGTVNFKTVYNQFYNLLLRRKKPTVIASDLSKSEILERKDAPFFIPDMLEKVFAKVIKYNAILFFTEEVDKNLILENGPIDLWS